jgi:hypothetical protein
MTSPSIHDPLKLTSFACDHQPRGARTSNTTVFLLLLLKKKKKKEKRKKKKERQK